METGRWLVYAHVRNVGKLQRFRSVAATCAVVIVAASLLSLLGIGPAVDRVAERSYYAWRGSRGSAPLLFVALDDDTMAAWGPPPWSWTRFEQLIEPMHRGGARLIALLEPGPRVVPDEPVPAELAAGVAQGWLAVPNGAAAYPQPAVVLSASHVVDAIDLGDPDRPSITRDVLERLGIIADGRTLAVDFIGGPDRLPTLPAHHVAAGELPPSTFSGRVIVIGLRGEQLTSALPTPVGAMSAGEIHAHALHALLAGARPSQMPLWQELLLVIALSAIGVLGIRRLRAPWLIVASAIGGIVVLYVVGYVAFRVAGVRIAFGGPALALVFAGLAGLVGERRDALGALDDLRRQLTRRLRLAASTRPGNSEAEILDRFAEMLSYHLPATSCVWAVLPPGAWHLELARWYQGSKDDVLEQRRDVRRDPWRPAYTSHKPEWSSRPFLKTHLGQKTLLLPVAAGGRLLGFWIINIPSVRTVGDQELRALEASAYDVAAALGQHHLEWRSAEARTAAPPGTGVLVHAVHSVRHDADTLVQIKDRMQAALEYLPIGVLSATSWGMIEQCNAAMRRFLAGLGLEVPERVSVADLLAQLAGTSQAGARDMLRDAALLGKTVRFVVTTQQPDAPEAGAVRYDVVLTRVEIGESALGEHVPTALVLTATARAPDDDPAGSRSDETEMGKVIALRPPR
ncbi:MAG TPA: CHASE2 domain-containing protein [Kofleriaceae bacterium]|nr:CHASE2 domain-containing protein [Kofleriaceae bacterium]